MTDYLCYILGFLCYICRKIRFLRMNQNEARFIGISRHRLTTDGEGVTTLAAFHGCPLRCRYCLNPHSLRDNARCIVHTPESLYEAVKIDSLYFIATNGGVTFGGGEPCIHSDFISRFRELCGDQWRLTVETSLNVPMRNVRRILEVSDALIIDIKDMNPDIYLRYTSVDNSQVTANLKAIAEAGRASDCLVRIPLIQGYNTDDARRSSRVILEDLGFSKFDLFTYRVQNN